MTTRKWRWNASNWLPPLIIPLVLLAASSFLPAQQPPPTPPVTEIELFQQILQAATPTARLELVEKFLAAFPNSRYRGHALVAASEAHRMRNEYDKAIEVGDMALAADPSNAIALILVADALSEGTQAGHADFDARLNKAEQYSKRALELLPKLFEAQPRDPTIPAEQYDLQEDYVEAQVHATLGYIYYRRNNFTTAEEELKLATDLNQFRPNSADFERLGMVQLQQKKYDLARDAFQRCVDVEGSSSNTCQRRLELLEQIVKEQKGPEAEKPQE